jgi:hypothetical protein
MNDPISPQRVGHGLPPEAKLASIGKVALRHAQLDNQFRMLVGDLTAVSKEEALDATVRDGSGQLRERVKRLAKAQFTEGPALVRLQALLERAARVTAKRNELMHAVWGTELDGGDMVRGDDHVFRPAPDAAELDSLEDAIAKILDDIIYARKKGFLAEALKNKPSKETNKLGE